MANRCGVYVIEQTGTGRVYIGSSAQIDRRWYGHRQQLNAGKHHAPRLQRAWTKYGAEAFTFSVLEECAKEDLLVEEQAYLDVLKPAFNSAPVAGRPPGWSTWSPAKQESVRQALRDRAAAITHCPKGHPYDEANTYRSKAGKRICRVCNAIRVSGVYAAETPEQREYRRVRAAAQAQREQDREARRAYTASHKEQKHAYDQSRVALTAERQHERRANRTQEQLEAVRESKRAAYWRNRDKDVQDLRERYRRTHPVPGPAIACKNGHPYTDESFDSKGMRICKPCRAASKRAYRERVAVR